MFLKPIHLIKEHWWPLTLSWPDEVQKMFFRSPVNFKKDLNHKHMHVLL